MTAPDEHMQLAAWLRNPWQKCDDTPRGPIPEWQAALMFEAANVIECYAKSTSLAQAAVAAAYEAAYTLGMEAGAWDEGHKSEGDYDTPLPDRLKLSALATPDQIAALAAERVATVTVKPLVWEDIAPHHSKAALPLFGSIRVESWGGDYSVVWSVPGMCDTFTQGKWATIEAAKAAAQSDYTTRILAALTPNTEAKP